MFEAPEPENRALFHRYCIALYSGSNNRLLAAPHSLLESSRVTTIAPTDRPGQRLPSSKGATVFHCT